jgi:hypothetical protein
MFGISVKHNKSQTTKVSKWLMLEVNSTGDSSATEVQNCQCLKFSDVRNLCKTQQKSDNKSQTTKVSSHYGVMLEVNSTGDSSATEVQGFKVFQLFDVRNSCKRRVETKIITGGDDH